MRVWSRRRSVARWSMAVVLAILMGSASPGAVSGGAAPGPVEPCVPGTIWEDLTSGVKYLCIYDEGYGGPRWDLLENSQIGAEAWLARSSGTGCALGTVGLTTIGGSGATRSSGRIAGRVRRSGIGPTSHPASCGPGS